jgi:hypothetical protein
MIQGLGGSRKGACIRHCDEGTQFIEVHAFV